jgi:hypothetical protein
MRFLVIVIVAVLISCQNQKKVDATKISKETIVADQTPKYLTEFCSKFDISAGLANNSFYGAFGDNYYRIDLHIDSVVKYSDCLYNLYGYTSLKSKKVKYVGNLKIVNVDRSNLNLYGLNDSINFFTQIRATYTLTEDKSSKGSGIFSGYFYLNVHLTKDNKIDFNTADWEGDGYSNYIFDGNWYDQSNKAYRCYFADGKLNIGDLNVGDGCFIPNKKYVMNGWYDFAEIFYSDDSVIMSKIRQLNLSNTR